MFVIASHRGPEHGVARQLLATLVSGCRARGLRGMFLGTAAKFLAAHRFYGKNGFHEVPRAEMPAGFPDIAVDTKFYVRALYRQDRRLRRYSALGRAAEQVAELRRRVSTIAEP